MSEQRITDAEVNARMPDDRFAAIAAAVAARPETFKPIPGYQYYEAGDKGTIRSIDRTVNGRFYPGKVLAARKSNRGYWLTDVRDDDGKKVTRTKHSLVLSAHAPDRPRGTEGCHEDDNPDHNWYPENLRWDTRPANLADRMRNSPAAPKPPKACVKCGSEFTGNGRRCHECVVAIGKMAAVMLGDGASLAEACVALDYPSAEGLHTLAVKYGGYAAPPPRSWSQRVMATVRGWFGRGDRP